jgi:hypothetical protein
MRGALYAINAYFYRRIMFLYSEECYTIKSINRLSNRYPYAASILVYTLIERILKIYCVNTNIIAKSEITNYPLGKLEKKLSLSKGIFSINRNNLIHSNLFFTEYGHKPKALRHTEHKKQLITAIDDLIEAVNFISKNDNIFLIYRKKHKIKYI